MSKTYHTWCTGVHLPLIHPLLSVLPILLGISEFPDNTQSSFEKNGTGGGEEATVSRKSHKCVHPPTLFDQTEGGDWFSPAWLRHWRYATAQCWPQLCPWKLISCVDLEKKGKLQSVVAYLWYRVPTQVKVVAAEATLRDDTSSKVILECAIVTSNIILEDT